MAFDSSRATRLIPLIVASALFMEDSQAWWVAGILGGLLGSVWNYAMTSVFTWRVKPSAQKVAVEG